MSKGYWVGDIFWRPYVKADAAVVALLHVETESALGEEMDLPDLADRPVVEAWVAERAGQVVGGFYLEATVEACFFGRDAKVSDSAVTIAPAIFGNMRRRGLHTVRAMVPRWIGLEARLIARKLREAGFIPTDERYTHFVHDLRIG